MAPPTALAPPRRGLGRGIAATVVAGLAVATVATAGLAVAPPATAGPAAADGSTTVTLSATNANTNGRTLVLTDLSGGALSASSSASSGLVTASGSAGFITGVADNNYTNSGYTVQATMSNLYKKTGPTSYDCSDSIPSGNVSVGESGALDLTNIAATVQPVFDLAGSLLAGAVTLPASPAPSVVGSATSLSATQLLGSGNAALATVGNLSGLPVQAAKGANAAFTNPAAFGYASCGTATGASTPILLSGTKNPGGVQGVLSAILGAPGTITAQSLINGGYTTLDAVKLAVAPLVTGGLGILNTLNITQLTGVLNSLRSVVTQSGTYKVSPTLTVNVPATASGQYVGIMTVTLADV